MPKMIQIRHVPEKVHQKLKSRAALAGTSLSDYLLQELSLLAEQRTLQEALAEISELPPVKWAEPVSKTVRRMRDSR